MIEIKCDRYDFKNMIIACNESTSCFSCIFHKFCVEENLDKGEFIADIVDIHMPGVNE